jgi:hypothetical protein
MIDIGSCGNNLIVVELYGRLFVCECLGNSGEYHRELKSLPALETGTAHCTACVKLQEAWDARHAQSLREQAELDAGL